MRLFLLLLSIIMFLSGCSGGSSDKGENVNEFAYLIDAPVEGVLYRCNDFNGTTASDGSFEYLSDCIIEFSVGGIALGEIPAALINDDKRVFLSELVGLDRDNISDPALVKLLQLLQSLDEDGNASNGIMISLDVRSKLSEASLDLLSDSVTASDINATLTGIGETLIDAQTALTHYIATLQSELGITFQVPSLSDFSTTVAESAAVGTEVGIITVVDQGDTSISSIVLSGNGAEDFNVADDGSITVAKTLDHARQSNYSLSAVATNASGESAPANVSITVAEVSVEVPTLSASFAAVAENITAGTAIGTVTITDPGDSAITAITLSGINHSHFSAAADGTITVVTPPDYEMQASYNLSAVATNAAGTSAPIPVTISVSDVADVAPALAEFSTTVPENTASGSVIGVISITDPGDSEITSIVLSGSGSGNFNVSNDGMVTVVNALDYETQSSYNLSGVGNNSAGSSMPINVTITVTNSTNEFVPALSASSATVVENAASSSVVGTIAIINSGDSPITAITLSGTNHSHFSAAADGTITVVTPPDYETQASYNLSAVATNDAGTSASVPVTITVSDVADVVPVLAAFGTTVSENTASGAVIGMVTITDPGDSTIASIALSGSGSVDFSVSTDGTITVANALDYETQTSYNLSAVATNAAGASVSVPVTIAISDVADVVPTLAEFSTTVPENTASGTVIGMVTITDHGDSTIASIALSGSGSVDFSVSTDGTITVANALDYETQASYNLSAVATNAAGSSVPVNVTITITDSTSEVVPTLATFTAEIAENSAAGTTVGSIIVSDPGDSAITAITLSGTNHSHFSAAADGTITVVTPPDYETQASYNLSAVATNDAGTSASVPVTITVSDVADVSPILAPFSTMVSDNTSVGSVVGTIIITDPGDSAITSIALSGSGSEDFSVANDGTITVVTPPDYETQSSYTLSAMATSASGESDPVNVTITISNASVIEEAKLVASDAHETNHFGASVDISGDYLVVGAEGDTSKSGAAYVYRKDGSGSFYEIAELNALDAGIYDRFGIAVSIDGPYVVVGAQQRADLLSATDAGAAYVFKNNGSDNYAQVAKLTAFDAAEDDHFGFSVAIDGDYVVVCADNKASGTGAVYVYKNNGLDDGYDQVDKLTASDANSGDYFGYSVAISGDYVAATAFYEDPFGAGNAGSAYIFKRDAGADGFSQIAKLNALDFETGDNFGRAVAISGEYVAIGAFYEDPNGVSDAGSAYVFKNDGADNYNQVAKLMAVDGEESDHFGYAISVSGAYVVVGAYDEDQDGSSAGAAYLFQNDGTDGYSQVDKITASDAAAGDRFGYAVAVSGSDLLIGAYNEDPSGMTNAGSAYIYQIVP